MNGSRTRQAAGLLSLLTAVAIAVAGCGDSTSPSVANLATTTSSSGPDRTSAASNTGGLGGGPAPTPAQLQRGALKFSQCMRSHGVPDFPDPSPGGGFLFQPGSGFNPSSPAVRAAQAKCVKFMPGGSPPSPGTVTHPSAQWLAQMVRAAACMRRHGYPDFPDPRTSVPAKPFGNSHVGVISNIDGVIFIFPGSIDITSPQFIRAANACGLPDHHR